MKKKLKEEIDKIIRCLLRENPAIAEDNVRIYNKTLCPELWSEDKKLNPEVRSALLKIAVDFFKDTELKLAIKDVYLLGSAANYNWTPQSDMDVHILVDTAPLGLQPEESEKFMRSLVGKWNLEHDIRIKGHKVELYIQDIREKNAATAVYSLMNNTWVKEPSPEKINVDKSLVQKKYTTWVNRINDVIKGKDEKKMKQILQDLKDCRQAGLDKGGEFSAENLVFKILRSRGFIGKLKDAFNSMYDKTMSVKDGFDPLSVGPNPEASEGESNGSYYQQQINKMRKMEEVSRKDIKSRHPNNPDLYDKNKHEWPMENLTLDNLKALAEKIKRFYYAYRKKSERTPEEEMEMGTLLSQGYYIQEEIRRRLRYINASPLSEIISEGMFQMSPNGINQYKIKRGSEHFANAYRVHPDWTGPESGKWVLNRDQGAFRTGVPAEWPTAYDRPEQLVADLEKWIQSATPQIQESDNYMNYGHEHDGDWIWQYFQDGTFVKKQVKVGDTHNKIFPKRRAEFEGRYDVRKKVITIADMSNLPTPSRDVDELPTNLIRRLKFEFGDDARIKRFYEEQAQPTFSMFRLEPYGKDKYKIMRGDEWFANTFKMPPDWGVQSNKWVLNRHTGAFKVGVPEKWRGYDDPNDLLVDLEKWMQTKDLKTEGYGAGKRKEDRLKIYNQDGSVRRWQIKSKDAPKTPKLPDALQELVDEVLDKYLPIDK